MTDSKVFVCTKETPWNKSIDMRVRHVEAQAVDGPSDYCEYYKCQVCGHTWKVELPE